MKLTKNFNKAEFDSKCGSEMPEMVLRNIKKLSINLQVLRDEIGQPIRINSGYRSPEHNKKVGGAVGSQHVFGNAADIVVANHSPQEVFQIIERLIAEGKMKEGGLKAYKTFCHYDIRGTKARW